MLTGLLEVADSDRLPTILVVLIDVLIVNFAMILFFHLLYSMIQHNATHTKVKYWHYACSPLSTFIFFSICHERYL